MLCGSTNSSHLARRYRNRWCSFRRVSLRIARLACQTLHRKWATRKARAEPELTTVSLSRTNCRRFALGSSRRIFLLLLDSNHSVCATASIAPPPGIPPMVRFCFPGGKQVLDTVTCCLAKHTEGRIFSESPIQARFFPTAARRDLLFPARRHHLRPFLHEHGIRQRHARLMRLTDVSTSVCWLTNHQEGPDPQSINQIS